MGDKEDVKYPIIERDGDGRQLYYENALGDWCRSGYDTNGNHIFNETSDGFWWRRVYNKLGVITHYSDSTGIEQDEKTLPEKEKIAAAIIDDDPIVSMYMRARVQNRHKELLIHTQHDPIIIPGMDIYIIDNQFDGEELAPDLVAEIRKTCPKALIIVMSATLTYDLLSAVLNNGCNGIYDKNKPKGNIDVFEMIKSYIEGLEHEREVKRLQRQSFVQKLLSFLGVK